MITEGELIEIEEHFRKLEYAITLITGHRYAAGEIENAAKYCRADMERLSDCIRRSAETGG